MEQQKVSEEQAKGSKHASGPAVQVLRKGVVTPTPRPTPVPRVEVTVTPRAPVAPSAAGGAHVVPARSFPPRVPRGPVSLETVTALARKERVPMRIAKGELDGKMKARIWRKLHREEAKRFDDAYELVAKHPELTLAEAFGVLQSESSVEEFQARKDRAQKRESVKEARKNLQGVDVSGLFKTWAEQQTELSVVLGERTLVDTLDAEQTVALKLGRSGRLEKLKVVVVASRAIWETVAPGLSRDAKLVQRPAGVAREPERRAFSDPRPFMEAGGEPVEVTLRNGMVLKEKLAGVGAFDLVLRSTDPAEALVVPLHAIVRWEH